MTDGAARYKFAPVASHEMVDHSKFEWVRDDVHTSTLEGFFSVLKRGLVGIYQHVDAKHRDRYLAELDFQQNTRAKLSIDDEPALILRSGPVPGRDYQITNSEAEA